MKHFLKIGEVDVMPLALALVRQPNLWNQHRARKDAGPVHAAMDDIWIRWRAPGELVEPKNYAEPHDAVWYPAYYALPQLRGIIFGLMARVEAVRLGGVLITRIPAGKSILPHADGGWHVEHFNTKIYVVLQSNPRCLNLVEDESVAMRPGECFYFDNTKTHSVENNGDDDRITLIVSLRCE